MIFSIDLVYYEMQLLHFKLFNTICMHQFGWLLERGGLFFKFASEGGGTKKGDSLRKRWVWVCVCVCVCVCVGGGGWVPTLEETVYVFC